MAARLKHGTTVQIGDQQYKVVAPEGGASRLEPIETPVRRELPTREDLLEICERALVTPESAWSDRDSSSATRQLGEAYALLKAGCTFYVEKESKHNAWWVHIEFRGFNYFEGDSDGMGPLDDDRFYIPLAERVVEGKDWY